MRLVTIIRKFVIVIVIVIVALSLYFGAYRPFQKGRIFIQTINSLSSVKSLAELKFRFGKVFALATPIAEDEVLGFFTDQMSGVLRSKPPKEIAEALILYIEDTVQPVLQNERGPELTKTILKMGTFYQSVYSTYGQDEYFLKAEELFKRGLAVSPNRPQFLYGLLGLYLEKKDFAKAREVGAKILKFWPADYVVADIISKIGG